LPRASMSLRIIAPYTSSLNTSKISVEMKKFSKITPNFQ